MLVLRASEHKADSTDLLIACHEPAMTAARAEDVVDFQPA
jgi:hypothetical protein